VVVNKWDLVHAAFRKDALTGYKNERDFREKFEAALFARLFFTPGAPVMFASALTGHEIDRMLKAARGLVDRLDRKLPTAALNQALVRLAERTPPPAVGNKRFRIYYATQTSTRPYRIKVFCNREEQLTESYRRYLEAGLVDEFDLAGCPIHFDLVGKKSVSLEERLARRTERTGAARQAGAPSEPRVQDD
jgi:GTP-binding protein